MFVKRRKNDSTDFHETWREDGTRDLGIFAHFKTGRCIFLGKMDLDKKKESDIYERVQLSANPNKNPDLTELNVVS